jgi:hypothetical protein
LVIQVPVKGLGSIVWSFDFPPKLAQPCFSQIPPTI